MGKSIIAKARLFALLFGFLFIAFGMIPAYIAVTAGLHSWKMAGSGMRSDGTIVDYVPVIFTQSVGRSRTIHYMPLVRFRTRAGEKTDFIELNHKLPKGDYPVLYLEANPKDAVVDHFMTLWKWPSVSVVLALLLFAIGGGVVSRSRRIAGD
jgi:hypothetical protein